MKKFYSLPVFLLLFSSIRAATAPDFTVTTSDGQVRNLYQDYVSQQKVVVLEIFFTTCPPCATHAPYLQALYQSMQSTYSGQVEFMLLSDKSADTNPVVASYLSSKNLTMPAAGADGGSLAAVTPYKNGTFGPFQGTPTFVVITPGTGEVFYDLRGNSPEETMGLISQKISELLPAQDCFVKSYFDNPIDSVQLDVAIPGGFDTSFIASGTYSLASVPELQNAAYAITPFKNSDPLQGLSTYDLVKIASHILGIQPFQFPWQMIAADMNCSGSVTTFDIVEGRKVILGINNGFSACGGATWRFVPEPDGSPSNGSCLNFRGIKIGDLTGPYFAPDDKAYDRNRISLVYDDCRLESGQVYTLPIRSGTDINISGLQLAFDLDPNILQIRRISAPSLPGFDERSYNPALQAEEGYLPVSWVAFDSQADVKEDAPLMLLEIRALHDVLLSDILHLSTRLKAEIYDGVETPRPLGLEWRNASLDEQNIAKISPNPAKSAFYVSLESERDGAVMAQLVNAEGRTVFEKSFPVVKGPNRFQIDPAVTVGGLYVLKLDGKPSGKIVLLR